MSCKLLSVIIPVYNNESTIDQLIVSLLQNPYLNMQLVIGNDCSTDNSYEIIKKYENNDRVKLFNSDVNLGPGAMRNKLLSMAEGDYIAIQDADDSFMTERFIEQINYLESNIDIDCVGTGVVFSYKGTIWKERCPKEVPTLFDWLLQRSMIHASIVFRSKLKSMALYHEKLRIGEDYYFLTKLYNQKIKFHNIQKKYYVYEINKERFNKFSINKFKSLIYAQVEISKTFNFPMNIVFIGVNYLKLVINCVRFLFSTKAKS